MVNKLAKSSKRKLMLIIIVLMWFSNYIYVPVLSTYCTAMGASLTMVGLILGSYGFTQMILRIPIGLLSDIFKNRRLFLFLSMFTSLISGIGFYFFTSTGLLLIFRALAGIAMSNWAIFITTYSALDDKEDNNSRSIGVVNSIMALGQLLGVFFGGVIAQYINVKGTFAVSAISSLIGLILLSFIDETYESSGKKFSLSNFTSVIKDSQLLFYSFMALLLQFITSASLTGFIPNLLSAISASEFEKGLGTTLALLPATFAAPLAIRLVNKRFGTKWTAVLGFGVLSVPMFFFPFIKSIPIMLSFLFLAGFGKGMLLPLFMTRATSHLPPDERSTALGAFQAIYGIGTWIGPAVTGYISNLFSLEMAFLFLGITGFTTIVSLLIYSGKKRGRYTLN